MGVKTKYDQRVRRKSRIRKRVTGTQQRPRLTVFRSARHIYAQIIDDTQGHTLVSACSLDKTVAVAADDTKKVDRATLVGKLVAERAKAKGIDKEELGQTAAAIRRLRPPEPYKGKGIKYAEERIQKKAGKTGTK